MWTTLLCTHVYAGVFSKSEASGRLLPRLLFGPDVFLQHARGFVPRLLPDLEFRNAVVECGRRETGAKWAPQRWRSRTPARPDVLFKIHATEAGFKADFCTFSPRLTLRKTGPLSMPAWRSHWSSARTGQVHSESGVCSGWLPRAISTSLPCPSWSVFDLGSVMVIAWACGWRCSNSIPASSDRRRPPANPIRIKARSRDAVRGAHNRAKEPADVPRKPLGFVRGAVIWGYLGLAFRLNGCGGWI